MGDVILSTQKFDGMNYTPKGKINRVVEPEEFNVGITALDHGHINGMSNGLIEAGATLKYVYDPDVEKVNQYLEQFPDVKVADSLEQILEDDSIHLVAAAAIPNLRSESNLEGKKVAINA